MASTYISILKEEKNTNRKNGLYDYITVTLAYNTNKIEGSTLTLSDIQSLYERDVVVTGGHRMDDLIESKNHFELFDFMLNTIDEPFTERLIKEFHQILKKGTSDEKWYGVGQYKKIPNIIGEQAVAQSHEVPKLMKQLLDDYNCLTDIKLIDILSFHHKFELIHPFQDGNGRLGRIIMFRQCLTHDITPFIVSSDRRELYIEGLKKYENNPNFLMQEASMQQEKFKEISKPFVESYLKIKNIEKKPYERS